MIKLSLIGIILLIQFNALAQPYLEGGKTRHRFAQLTFGLDHRWFPGNGSNSAIINSVNQIEKFQLNDLLETRVMIGGTHFWGHADFYIAIPVLSLGKSGFSTGAETGAKLYPWRIKHNKIRPYVGVSMLPTLFQQGLGAEKIRFTYPVSAGLTYHHKNHLIELGAGHQHQNKFNYFIDRSTINQVKTQPYMFSLAYKMMIDVTLSAEKDWLNGKTQKLTDTLSSLNRLNGFTMAIGPSSAFFLKTSSKANPNVPYSENHKSFAIFPEFGFGYYLHQPDLQLNIAFRSMNNEIQSYDFNHAIKRQALTLEAFRFWGDYHGFAMFAGVNLNSEWLNVTEVLRQQITMGSDHSIKPGLTFGWDIRPNRLQAWYLRTNLRYIPNLTVKMQESRHFSFDQLEFNFIQLVIFPGRFF